MQALQLNAGLGNVAEMDDVHRTAILHPGPVVVPVALAMTQSRQGSLQDCLEAIVRGYEAAIRLGRSLGKQHYAYFHNTATIGTPAAAATAAAALKLNSNQMLWALANACSRTGGLWQMRHEPVLTKQWHCIAAAIEGTLAACLAESGLTGPASILEGEQGFYAALSPDAKPEQLRVDEQAWLIEQVSFKPWPACRHAHASIDAAKKIYSRLSAEDMIQSVQVTTYADALKLCDNENPETELQARFSLQHSVALALSGADITLDDFLPQTPAFAALAPMRGKIRVTEGRHFTEKYPAHFGSHVSVQLASGVLEASVQDAWGDPEVPMSQEAIKAKAWRMMQAGGLTDAQAGQLQTRVLMTDLSSPVQEIALP